MNFLFYYNDFLNKDSGLYLVETLFSFLLKIFLKLIYLVITMILLLQWNTPDFLYGSKWRHIAPFAEIFLFIL